MVLSDDVFGVPSAEGRSFPPAHLERLGRKASCQVAANPLSRDLGILPFFANSKTLRKKFERHSTNKTP